MDVGRLSNQLGADAKGQEMVQRIKTVAERTVQTVRNMALLLRPSMLDDLGLVSALEWYAREVSRSSETEVEVKAENVSETLPDSLMVCIYRVVQEAVNNAIKHGHASQIVIRLAALEDQGALTIQDNGCGIGKIAPGYKGVGLHLMNYRARMVGGSLEVQPIRAGGTMVTCLFPVGDDTNPMNKKI